MPDVKVQKFIAAPREVLFDAFLDPETLSAIMRPGMARSATVEVDPRVGGRFDIVMHAPNRDYPHTGEYRIIDRPSKLVFTWISDGTHGLETLVTIELEEQAGGTLIVLTHETLPDEEAADHQAGWGKILEHLAHASS